MKVLSHLKIYSAEDGSDLLFEVKGGVFCYLFDSKSKKSVAWSMAPSIKLSEINSLVGSLLKNGDYSNATLSSKIVGAPAQLKILKESLESHKISVSKMIEKDEKFEILFLPLENRIRLSVGEGPATPKVSQIVRERTPTQPLKVLIVDDSKTIRQLLEKLFSSDPMIKVVGSLEDPREVEKAIELHKPDVMTLDIHMPHMDGVMVLKKVIPRFRIPTVMISSISIEEGPLVLNALEAGAVDYIQKPTFDQLAAMKDSIIEKVKTAALAQVKVSRKTNLRLGNVSLKNSSISLVVIGSSTGGTEALKDILTSLPENIPPTLIVQHIPPVFSKAFADRMNALCPFEVKEAQHGDAVLPDRVLIAPGGMHMKLKKTANSYCVELEDSAPVNRFKPSVDVLFKSVCELTPQSTMGIILTGMGSDGAKGLLSLRQNGAVTLGQDESSCIVYGMPKAAFEVGAVEHVVSLDKMAEKMLQLMKNIKSTKAS